MSVQIPVDILHHFLQLVLHQVCFHKILEVLIFLCLPPRICIQLLLIPWLSRPNHHQFRVPHQEIIVKQIHEIFQIILHRIRYHQDLNQFNNTIPIIFTNRNNNYIHHNLTILQLIKTVNSNYLIQIFSQVPRIWFDEKKKCFENTLI